MIRDVRANRRTFVPVSLSPSSGRKAGRRVFVENHCAKNGSSNLTGVFARERNRRRKHVRQSGIVDADTESDVNRKLHPGERARESTGDNVIAASCVYTSVARRVFGTNDDGFARSRTMAAVARTAIPAYTSFASGPSLS